MFGALGRAGEGRISTYICTEGSSSPLVGFSDLGTSFGSMSPNSNFLTTTIRRVIYNTTSDLLFIWLNTWVAQSYFYSLQMEDGTEVLTSAATWQQTTQSSQQITEWQWSQAEPARWDGTGTSWIKLKY